MLSTRSSGTSYPTAALGAAAAALCLVAASAFIEELRWPGLVVLGLGVAAALSRARPRDRSAIWLWAALLPVQARLAYTTLQPVIAPGLADCASLLSPIAVARVVEASVVLGVLAAAAVLLRADRESLNLRGPARPIVALSVAGPLVAVPLGLVVGPALTLPFFGPIGIELGLPLAILPATALALANASMEEIVFRGAILGWGSRVLGASGALAVQAVLFGVAHVGPDFRDGLVMLPVLAAVTLGGLIAGVLVRRTGSLLPVIAIHAALDVPLYYAFACRLPV